MQDEGIGLGEFHAGGVELIEKDVIVVREGRFEEAFGLDAEDDDDVGVAEALFDLVYATDRRAWRDFFEFARDPHGRAAKCEAATELSE